MKISAIVLAAGESTRIGKPKPLLDWFGAPLVQRQVESLLKAGVDEVFVVTGHRASEVNEAVSGKNVHRILNQHYLKGKSTSVKAGLTALPAGTDAIVVLAADQPRPASLICDILQSHADNDAVISCPRFKGRGGHPIVFSSSLVVELDGISEDTHGLHKVVRLHAREINWVEVDTSIARLDMNTPEAYQTALKQYPDPRRDG